MKAGCLVIGTDTLECLTAMKEIRMEMFGLFQVTCIRNTYHCQFEVLIAYMYVNIDK